MSGIVCLLNLNGAPVGRERLDALTAHLAHRGPDAQATWTCGPVGFGHSLLRTTFEAEHEQQPLSLDQRVWIVADCRLDARADLHRALSARDCAPARSAPDVEYLLQAYRAWGGQCVDHLLGDFAFVIWDAARRSLFCARDQLGLKTLFYARAGDTLVVSNDLECMRLHPAISADLDEVAIADHLLHGYSFDLDRTCFECIRRLPPAHSLRAVADEIQVQRYWSMPSEEQLRFRRRGDCVDQFRDLLDTAVRDRLRTDRVAVLMSGGLDSTSVAATAKRLLDASGAPHDLRAHTFVFDRIVPDQERRYSTIAAQGIGIPITHYPMDDDRFPTATPEPEWYPPEPKELFSRGRAIAAMRGPAGQARVILRADGADPLLDGGSVVPDLFATRRYTRLAGEFLWLTWARRSVPRIGFRSRLLRLAEPAAASAGALPPFPDWLARDFEQRLHIRQRWARRFGPTAVVNGSNSALADPYWAAFVESNDPGAMRLPAEMRFPFFDLRLVRFLARLAPLPWLVEKSVLRIAMRGALPAGILRRRKSPTAGNPWAALLTPAGSESWERLLDPAPDLQAYVDTQKAKATLSRALRAVQQPDAPRDIDGLWSALQPVSLNLWLRQIACANVNSAPADSRG